MASNKSGTTASTASPDANVLMEAMLSITGDLDLNHVLTDIVTRAATLVGTHHGFIDLFTGQGITLERSYRIGIFRDFNQAELKAGVGVSGTVWQTGRPLFIPDYNTWNNRLSKVSQNAVYAVIAVPVRARDGAVIGVLGMAHVTPEHSFTSTQVELLSRFAQLAAVAIDNARLYLAAQHEIEERKRAEIAREQVLQLLEQRVAERTQELSILLDATQVINRNLSLPEVLSAILDQLKRLIGFDSASIRAYEPPDHLRLLAYSGPTPPEQRQTDWPFDPSHIHVVEVIEQQHPVIISDLLSEGAHAKAQRQRFMQQYGYIPEHIRCWLGVPLIAHGRVVGILIVQSSQANYFTQTHAQMTLALANQATISIENARLFENEQARRADAERRQQVSSIMSNVVRILNSDQSLDATLRFVLQQAEQLLNIPASAVFRLDVPSNQLMLQCAHGLADLDKGALAINLRSNALDAFLHEGNPIVITQLAKTPYFRANDPKKRTRLQALKTQFQSAIIVPLRVRADLYGAIILFYDARREFSTEYLALAEYMADQLALSIENARLREASARNAASAERSRLARELHDSVSQALFAMLLMMRTARELLHRDPSKALMPIDESLTLADGALTEMRALIFELRPESLAQEGLCGAFRKQASALTARHKIDVQTHFGLDEPDLTLEAKEALYRIGLEAIQNTIKHAGASKVELRLFCDDAYATLEVADNGEGFNPDRDFPGHLGLQSMRERAELHGGVFEIVSEYGTGTTVRARLPLIQTTELTESGE